MDHNLGFGGGAAASTMHPAVLVLSLIAAVAVLLLPRKYALAAVLGPTFLTPYGEQLYIGGLHLYVIRILVLAGGLRLVWVKLSSSKPLFGAALSSLDKVFVLWAFFRAATFVLLYQVIGAFVAQTAFCLDAIGGYFLFRYLIQDRDDIVWATKIFALVVTILAVCMVFEYETRINIFSYIDTHAITPWLRDGRIRAQGTFGNSITAGVFGATLLPLFFWLWKSVGAKFWCCLGLTASTIIVLTSVASTAVMAYAGAALALLLWPLRNHTRTMRWGVVLALLAVALMMKAPVWFVIARVDVIGGSHGWDRAYLIDQTIRHFFDWWLLGTKERATWGNDTWDACNQFVAEATGGGLISLVLFVGILRYGFGLIGRARKQVQGDAGLEWFYWCLGATLFSSLMALIGVDYFDTTMVEWFIFLAIISTATACPLGTQAAADGGLDIGPGKSRFSYSSLPMSILRRSRLIRYCAQQQLRNHSSDDWSPSICESADTGLEACVQPSDRLPGRQRT